MNEEACSLLIHIQNVLTPKLPASFPHRATTKKKEKKLSLPSTIVSTQVRKPASEADITVSIDGNVYIYMVSNLQSTIKAIGPAKELPDHCSPDSTSGGILKQMSLCSLELPSTALFSRALDRLLFRDIHNAWSIVFAR